MAQGDLGGDVGEGVAGGLGGEGAAPGEARVHLDEFVSLSLSMYVICCICIV